MSNMSHCRFLNTLKSLRDCWEHIEDYDLTLEETKTKEKLIKLCVDIACDYGDCKPTE